MRLKKLTNNKWFKRLVLPLLVLLFLILITALVINFIFSPVLSTQLKKTVLRLSNGLYQADFSESNLYIVSGRIIVDNLVLKPDTAVFNHLKKEGKAPNNLYTLRVDRIVLKRFHPFRLYFKKELNVDDIVVSQPSVQVMYQELRNHDLPDSGKKTIYQRIAGTLKSVHVGHILLNNIDLYYHEDFNHRIKNKHLKEMDIKATDLLIDSSSQNDKSRFNFCKDITAVLNNYNGDTADSLYHYEARSVTFSSSRSSITMANAVFMPLKTVTDSVKPSASNGTFKLETDSICIDHFNYKAFFNYRNFIASDITVYGKSMNVFYDRTLSPRPIDSVKNGLYDLLKNVHSDIAVRTLRLKDIDLIYTEVSAKTKLRGAITFEQLNGSINNITTGNDTFKTNRKLSASLTANLMGYGKLNLNLDFDPADPKSLLYYKGSLGIMNLVNLNPATKSLGLIQFTNGIVTNLSFDMQASAEKVTGKVAFLYRDLNVVLLKQDEKNALRRMSFISILANAIVLIRNNPTYNNPPRVATVVYQRPENVSYLGSLWWSVCSGIKESIGLSAEIEQELRQKLTDYKQHKEERESKKASRQDRRRARRLKRHLRN